MDGDGSTRRATLMALMLFLAPVTTALPQNGKDSDEDFDAHKLRISAFLFYSNPSGSIQGSHDADMIDLQKDFSFNSYSTFTGKLDWKFTHKNHFYLVGSDFNQTRQVVLKRTITFQGQTFQAGAIVNAQLDSPEIARDISTTLSGASADISAWAYRSIFLMPPRASPRQSR